MKKPGFLRDPIFKRKASLVIGIILFGLLGAWSQNQKDLVALLFSCIAIISFLHLWPRETRRWPPKAKTRKQLIKENQPEAPKPLDQFKERFRSEVAVLIATHKDNNSIKSLVLDYLDAAPVEFLLLTKYLVNIERLIAAKYPVGDLLLLSSEQQRKDYHTFDADRSAPDFKDYCGRYLEPLVTTIRDRFHLPTTGHAYYTTWHFLTKAMVPYYSFHSAAKFRPYFTKIKDLSLEQCIKVYCKITAFNSGDPLNTGLFTCFLMTNKKLGESKLNEADFLQCKEYLTPLILDQLEDHRIKKFERRLFFPAKKSVYTIDEIDTMTGVEFENFCALLLTKMGYEILTVNNPDDQRINFIAAKNNLRIGIKTKCHFYNLPVSVVTEALTGLTHAQCTQAIVISNNYFSRQARELAKASQILLWDRSILKAKIIEQF